MLVDSLVHPRQLLPPDEAFLLGAQPKHLKWQLAALFELGEKHADELEKILIVAFGAVVTLGLEASRGGGGCETCPQVESFEQVGVLAAHWKDKLGVVGVLEHE